MTSIPTTANLCDTHQEGLECCDLPFHQFGGIRHFQGPLVTFRSFEDNLQLKSIIEEPGEGRVLVVDTQGSTRVAMLGDNMAARAAENGWTGVLLNGAVRDSAALRALPIGIVALGTNPRRSRKEGAGQQDVTVAFGGAVFIPGRQLVSDEDGVVVLP